MVHVVDGNGVNDGIGNNRRVGNTTPDGVTDDEDGGDANTDVTLAIIARKLNQKKKKSENMIYQIGRAQRRDK
jgi:hypothetical protein